jgi:hypothetical protein
MAEQVRERIRGLLVKVGDERKKAVGNIKGLVSVLQEDMSDQRDTIMISLIECAKYLPTKAGVYGTWLALMNPNNRVFVSETVNGLYSELRYAIMENNLVVSCCLIRVLIECANTGCVSVTSVVAFLRKLLESCSKSGFRKSEFGLYLVISCLPWFSSQTVNNNAEVSQLIQSTLTLVSQLVTLGEYQQRRDLVSPLAGFPDKLESALNAVDSLKASGWENMVLIRPYMMEGLMDQLPIPTPEFIHSVPTDDETLFDSIASGRKFVPPVIISTATASGEDQPLSLAEVFLLQELLDNTVSQFHQSVGECGKALLRIPVIHSQFEPVLVDVLVSRSLMSTNLVPAYYHSLIHRCLVLQESLKPHLEAAIVLLSNQSLTEDKQFALADLMTFLLTNNTKLERLTEVPAVVLSKFMEVSIRLNFINSLQTKISESLQSFLPPEPGSGNGFNMSDSELEAYQQMKEVVRIKDGSEVEVLQIIQGQGDEGFRLFIHALVENARTITHLLRLLDLYRNLVRTQARSDEEREAAILDAVFAFWSNNNEFRLEKSCDIFLSEGFVTPLGIVRRLNLLESKWSCYTMISLVVDFLVRRRASLIKKISESVDPPLELTKTDTENQIAAVAKEVFARASPVVVEWMINKYRDYLGADMHPLLELF